MKVALVFFVVLSFVYGIIYLLSPQTLVELAGGAPVHPNWLRWAGAVLLGLSMGALRALKQAEKQ